MLSPVGKIQFCTVWVVQAFFQLIFSFLQGYIKGKKGKKKGNSSKKEGKYPYIVSLCLRYDREKFRKKQGRILKKSRGGRGIFLDGHNIYPCLPVRPFPSDKKKL